MDQNSSSILNLDLFRNIPTETHLTIIADSGGTKTSWAIIAKNNVIEIETSSYHVNQFETNLSSKFTQFLKNLILKYPNNTLHFYGAGCLNQSNQLKTEVYFQSLGFKKTIIKSDLIGAAKALFNKNEGIVAILGTGSVAIHYKDEKIVNRIGGLGYLIGDEGSGYFFGKTLLNELLNHKLDKNLSEQIHKIIGTRDEIMNNVYSETSKLFIGSIAQKISSISKHQNIQEIHRKNLQVFIENLINSLNTNLPVGIIGSYGYHNQVIINEFFLRKKIPSPFYISHPIKQLIEQYKYKK